MVNFIKPFLLLISCSSAALPVAESVTFAHNDCEIACDNNALIISQIVN